MGEGPYDRDFRGRLFPRRELQRAAVLVRVPQQLELPTPGSTEWCWRPTGSCARARTAASRGDRPARRLRIAAISRAAARVEPVQRVQVPLPSSSVADAPPIGYY
jgi:hypothetical protein